MHSLFVFNSTFAILFGVGYASTKFTYQKMEGYGNYFENNSKSVRLDEEHLFNISF